MTFQNIVPWPVLAIASLALLGFMAWRIVAERADRQICTAWVRRAAIGLLIVIMAAGPSIPGANTPSGMINLDVIFAVDTTTSMGALDYGPNKQERLEGVRHDIVAISDQLAGARFGLVTFDQEATMPMPMTTDRSALAWTVDGLARESSAYSKGSSIDKPIDRLKQQFEADKKRNPSRPQLLFYFGDGEQTAAKKPASFAPLAPYIDGGAVLGYGTAAGGKMKIYYGYDDKDPCTSSLRLGSCYVGGSGSGDAGAAVSKIDESALRTIASQTSVPYIHATSPDSVDDIASGSHAERIANNSREVSSYAGLYWVLAFLLVPLAAWELWYLLGRIRDIPATKETRP